MNQAFLFGNVGRSDVKEISPGMFAINFTIATEDSWKDKEGKWQKKTEWHNCVLFTKDRERAPLKGQKVFVDGPINTRSWEKDGQKKYTTEIRVKNLVVASDNNPKPAPDAPVFDEGGSFKEQIPF